MSATEKALRHVVTVLKPVFWMAVIFGVLFAMASIPTNGRDPLTGIQFRDARGAK